MLRYAMAAIIAFSSMSVASAQSDPDRPRWMANMVRHQKVIMYGVQSPWLNPLPVAPHRYVS